MKNITNNKISLLPSLCIAGTLFLFSACSDNKTSDSRKVAEQENISQLATDDKTILVIDNDNDANFLMTAAAIQLEEISLGKLAQQKSNVSHVKELGKMMEQDHTKVLNELKALAQSKSISIPASITDNARSTYDKLNKKSGNDFGKAYSEMMVEHHEDAIDLFERASAESNDADIRNWATSKLPGLRTHLQHAEKCKEECDNMK